MQLKFRQIFALKNFFLKKSNSVCFVAGLYARKNAIPSLTNHDIRDACKLMSLTALKGQ